MALENPDNPLNIPADEPLPGYSKPVPFVLTGDEAFPLSEHMLKPYPNRNLSVEQRVANKRISRGRRISENLLGILVNRWRCFKVPFLLRPSKVKIITLAALSLHNWLRADASSRMCVVLQPWLTERTLIPVKLSQVHGETTVKGSHFWTSIPQQLRINYSNDARCMREELTRWFTDEGDLSWQRKTCGL